MNDETRLDAQVRSALAELPMPDDATTREALREVLRQGHTERAPSRWLAPVLVAAAVIAILALVGSFVRLARDQVEPTPAPSSQLIGDWQRDVVDAPKPGWDGSWLMTFGPEGVLALHGPATAAASSDGASYALSRTQVRVDVFVNSTCSELPAGVYAWSRTADVLTLALVSDPCPARANLLAGTWRRP